jgi:hypothetical protein
MQLARRPNAVEDPSRNKTRTTDRPTSRPTDLVLAVQRRQLGGRPRLRPLELLLVLHFLVGGVRVGLRVGREGGGVDVIGSQPPAVCLLPSSFTPPGLVCCTLPPEPPSVQPIATHLLVLLRQQHLKLLAVGLGVAGRLLHHLLQALLGLSVGVGCRLGSVGFWLKLTVWLILWVGRKDGQSWLNRRLISIVESKRAEPHPPACAGP